MVFDAATVTLILFVLLAVTPRPNPAGTSIPFTLTVGPMRYYIMGAGA